MDLAYVKKVIKLVEKSDVDEIEIEEEGKKIRVAKHRNSQAVYQIPAAQSPFQPALTSASPAMSQSAEAPPAPAKTEVKYHEIRSPIVGTFYRAPAPDAEVYVEAGQDVKPGTVLCIVEAMKLMNEIESDVEGKIVKVLAENGKPVEYNQVLFLIDQS
ncbi:MAG: acetyl-CoA carboxylase biotin carboxyl carrier protein [Ignavibacteriales bacterium]|nr:acetyl-CoA carboxylase biotin carboxyl carrier protein [Ignavibacteriales bacterium]